MFYDQVAAHSESQEYYVQVYVRGLFVLEVVHSGEDLCYNHIVPLGRVLITSPGLSTRHSNFPGRL